MLPLPFEARATAVDAHGWVYAAGMATDEGPAGEGENRGVAYAFDGDLRPRWSTRLLDDSLDGVFFVGDRLYVCRYPDVCIALDPATGAILDADAPLLPSRLAADVDGSFLCDLPAEVARVKLAVREGACGTRFGFDAVPLFDPPPPPPRGFFARLLGDAEVAPSADGARFATPLGDGSFAAFEAAPTSALVRYDRAGARSVLAAISGGYGLDALDDLQRAGERIFLRARSRLLLVQGGAGTEVPSMDELDAFAALPGGDLVLFGEERVVRARREDGYRVAAPDSSR